MRQKSGIRKKTDKSPKSSKAGNLQVKRKVKSLAGKIPASRIREAIIKALSHSEAEDGLYFRNFFHLHEEDQRPGVKASKQELLVALNELLEDGLIRIDYDELEVTFRLA